MKIQRRAFLKKIRFIYFFPFLKYFANFNFLKIKNRWLFKVEDI